jgi:Uma2 family endonuclease
MLPPEVIAELEEQYRVPPEAIPNVHNLVTEDDTPLDNILSEKQARLLIDALRHSWPGQEGKPYVAMMNIGLFITPHEKPLVPDFLLALDAAHPENWWREKEKRSYFVWEFGRSPDLVAEIVSNREGEEDTRKLKAYAEHRIPYYVIYDPHELLGSGKLRVYQLQGISYRLTDAAWISEIGLGLKIWECPYEGAVAPWLRWCDQQGNLLLTGSERLALECQRADQEKQRADQEKQRADLLAEQLRQAGIEPKRSKRAKKKKK